MAVASSFSFGTTGESTARRAVAVCTIERKANKVGRAEIAAAAAAVTAAVVVELMLHPLRDVCCRDHRRCVATVNF